MAKHQSHHGHAHRRGCRIGVSGAFPDQFQPFFLVGGGGLSEEVGEDAQHLRAVGLLQCKAHEVGGVHIKCCCEGRNAIQGQLRVALLQHGDEVRVLEASLARDVGLGLVVKFTDPLVEELREAGRSVRSGGHLLSLKTAHVDVRCFKNSERVHGEFVGVVWKIVCDQTNGFTGDT